MAIACFDFVHMPMSRITEARHCVASNGQHAAVPGATALPTRWWWWMGEWVSGRTSADRMVMALELVCVLYGSSPCVRYVGGQYRWPTWSALAVAAQGSRLAMAAGGGVCILAFLELLLLECLGRPRMRAIFTHNQQSIQDTNLYLF